jgi:hypothetical protein
LSFEPPLATSVTNKINSTKAANAHNHPTWTDGALCANIVIAFMLLHLKHLYRPPPRVLQKKPD